MTSPPSMRESIRRTPRAVWILYGGTFVNRFGSFVVVFLVLYLTDLGYEPAQAGLAVGGYGAGAFAAATVGGLLTDRLGRRWTIAISMFGSAASVLALSQATGLPTIVALTASAGAFGELYRPASSALMADLIPPEDRVVGFAAYRLAINLGFTIGPATAGFLAQRSYLWLFIGDAVTSIAYGVAALVALPEGVRSRSIEELRGEALRTVLRDRRFLLFLLATVASSLVYFQSQSTFALHVRASGLSDATYGALISLNGLICVLLELPLTSITRRMPRWLPMTGGAVLVAIGFGATAGAGTALLLGATVVVWTLGEIVQAPVSSAYVADLAPPHLRGRYASIWGLAFSLSLIVAPVAGGALFDLDPRVLWLSCGAMGLIAAALVFAAARGPVRPVATWEGARPEEAPVPAWDGPIPELPGPPG